MRKETPFKVLLRLEYYVKLSKYRRMAIETMSCQEMGTFNHIQDGGIIELLTLTKKYGAHKKWRFSNECLTDRTVNHIIEFKQHQHRKKL